MNGVQPSTLWKHSPGGAPRGIRTEDAKGGPGATSPLWVQALGPWRSPGLGLSGWVGAMEGAKWPRVRR